MRSARFRMASLLAILVLAIAVVVWLSTAEEDASPALATSPDPGIPDQAPLSVLPAPSDVDTGVGADQPPAAAPIEPVAPVQFSRQEPPDPVSTPRRRPAASAEASDSGIPSLAESDVFVRTRALGLGVPSQLVATSGLIRRLALNLYLAARGELAPARFRASVAVGDFPAQPLADGRYRLDPAGYRRFDALISALEAIDPEAMASFLKLIRPLIHDALQEYGYDEDPDAVLRDAMDQVFYFRKRGEQGPDAVLRDAMDQVLAAPAHEGDIELIRPGLTYQFADPALENQVAVRKQLLRIGPDNTRRLQRYLLRLRIAL